MSRNVHTVLFAVVLCCVISVLLTAASTGLQKFQQKNIRLDRQKNILKSVGPSAFTTACSFHSREIAASP